MLIIRAESSADPRNLLLLSTKPAVLLENKTVGHSRHVVADNPMQRLAPRLLLVARRQLVWRLHKEREHLCNHMLGLLLVALLRRTVINVLVEKFFDLL